MTLAGAEDTRTLAVRGARWVAAEKWLVRALGFVVFLVLARLLEPAEFGLVALAHAAVAFFGIFVDQGIGMALVTRAELTREHRDSAFYAAVLGGLVMAAVAGLSAPWFAALVGEERVTPLVQVLALGFVLSSLQTVPLALLTREMAFRAQSLRRMTAAVAGAVTGLSLAVAGAGVWALVAQALVANAVGVVVLWSATSWRPGRHGTWASFRELWRVGVRLLALNLLSYGNEQGDSLAIGGLVGAVPLGLYSVGSRFLRFVLDILTSTIVPLALPTFTRLRGDPTARTRAFLKATRLSSFVAVPVFLALGASASDLVPYVFGEQWKGSVPIMQALALVGLVHCMTYFDRALLLACDRSGAELKLTLLATGGNIIAYLCVIPFGVVGVAVALAIRNYLMWPLRVVVLRRLAGVPTGQYFAQWARPLLPALLSSAGLGWFTATAGGPNALDLVLSHLVAAAAYLVGCRIVAPALLREVLDLAAEVVGRRRPQKPVVASSG